MCAEQITRKTEPEPEWALVEKKRKMEGAKEMVRKSNQGVKQRGNQIHKTVIITQALKDYTVFKNL